MKGGLGKMVSIRFDLFTRVGSFDGYNLYIGLNFG